MSLTCTTRDSKGYALMIALLPVIMVYRVPFIELGLSTVLIAAGLFYALIVCTVNGRNIRYGLMIPFVLYCCYAGIKGGVINTLLGIAIIAHLAAISTGALNADYLKKVITAVALAAAVATAIQFVVHLLTGRHIPMIVSDWCLTDLEYYRKAITTGVGRHETMYRPSAFFLEPSHMALYCVVALCFCLLKDNPDYKKAIIISAGMVFTTSGMGIVMVAAVWLIFPFVTARQRMITLLKRILFLVVIAGVALVILSRLPFFQSALARITGPISYSGGQYNAIWGRTVYWGVYITPMQGKDLFLGYGLANKPPEFFTGWMTIIYCYGVLGLTLLYVGMIAVFIKCKDVSARIILAIFGAVLSMSASEGFINIIFYVGIALASLRPNNKPTVLHGGYRKGIISLYI